MNKTVSKPARPPTCTYIIFNSKSEPYKIKLILDSSDEGMEDQVDEDIKALIRSQFEEGVAKSSSSRRGTAGVKSSSRRGTARSMTSVITGVGELDSSSISQAGLLFYK